MPYMQWCVVYSSGYLVIIWLWVQMTQCLFRIGCIRLTCKTSSSILSNPIQTCFLPPPALKKVGSQQMQYNITPPTLRSEERGGNNTETASLVMQYNIILHLPHSEVRKEEITTRKLRPWACNNYTSHIQECDSMVCCGICGISGISNATWKGESNKSQKSMLSQCRLYNIYAL